MDNNILNYKRMLYNKWFYNFDNNKKNNEILLIIVPHYNEITKKKIIAIFKKNNIENIDCIYGIDEWIDLAKIDKQKIYNAVLISDYDGIIDSIKKIDQKIIFADQVILEQINTKSISNNIPKNIEKLLYVKKSEPPLLTEECIDDIRDFIITPLGYYKNYYKIFHFLIKDTNISYSDKDLIESKTNITIYTDETKNQVKNDQISIKGSIQSEYISRDITILLEKGILTSRLAVIMYRKYTLDFKANVTKIGRYFSNIYGKSKSVDLKRITDCSVNYDGLTKTTVKAYNIRSTVKSKEQIRLEEEIKEKTSITVREEIARKLMLFTNLDINEISKIVALPKTSLKKFI
jgi:hypothetical protein